MFMLCWDFSGDTLKNAMCEMCGKSLNLITAQLFCSSHFSTLLLLFFHFSSSVAFLLHHNKFTGLSSFNSQSQTLHYNIPPSCTDKTLSTLKMFCRPHYCLIVHVLQCHCIKTVLWQNLTQKCPNLSNIVCFHLSLLYKLDTIPQLSYQKWVGMD